jgi:hypothetical protein
MKRRSRRRRPPGAFPAGASPRRPCRYWRPPAPPPHAPDAARAHGHLPHRPRHRLRALHCRCQCCHLHLHHNSLWYVHICVCDMFIDALCVKMKNLVVNISCACVIGISDISRFSCRTWRCVWSRRRIEFLGEQHFQHLESSQRKWL